MDYILDVLCHDMKMELRQSRVVNHRLGSYRYHWILKHHLSWKMNQAYLRLHLKRQCQMSFDNPRPCLPTQPVILRSHQPHACSPPNLGLERNSSYSYLLFYESSGHLTILGQEENAFICGKGMIDVKCVINSSNCYELSQSNIYCL